MRRIFGTKIIGRGMKKYIMRSFELVFITNNFRAFKSGSIGWAGH
jgi:hypothetical protein